MSRLKKNLLKGNRQALSTLKQFFLKHKIQRSGLRGDQK